MKRIWLSTLMLLIVIAALVVALLAFARLYPAVISMCPWV
jgi:hypothetical protein